MTEEMQRQRFVEVVMPHLDDGLSLARWLTGSPADGEDVMQEAAIRAFGALGNIEGDSPRAWLLAIVRNTAFTWLRKNRPKALVVTSDPKVFELARGEADDLPSPEAAIIASVDAAAVQAALAGLPVVHREIIVMRELNELSYREIATVTGLPIGTVMSRLSRARQALADRLGRRLERERGRA